MVPLPPFSSLQKKKGKIIKPGRDSAVGIQTGIFPGAGEGQQLELHAHEGPARGDAAVDACSLPGLPAHCLSVLLSCCINRDNCCQFDGA